MPNYENVAINSSEIQKVIDNFAFNSLRTISVAYKDVTSFELENAGNDFFEENFNLIAIAGIQDPLREGVSEAITKCKTAGINVRMVTGDNVMTAQAIAKDCGILDSSYDMNYLVSQNYYLLFY